MQGRPVLNTTPTKSEVQAMVYWTRYGIAFVQGSSEGGNDE
jgi:hypothetical protein